MNVNLATGDIWVADPGANSAIRYPNFNNLTAGNLASNATLSDYEPLAVAEDNWGNLFVADNANRVVIYYPGLSALNAANFLGLDTTPQFPLAPGVIAALYSTGNTGQFGTTSASATSVPLPKQLNGVEVLVNNTPAPLFYAGTDQINFEMPSNAPQSGTADLQAIEVATGRVLGDTTVAMYSVSPGIFTQQAIGSGPGVIANQDGTLNTQNNPAKDGSVVTIYMTGQGYITGMPADGDISNGPLSTPYTPTVYVGGANLVPPSGIRYSGLAPTLVGVWQINVQIPSDASPWRIVPPTSLSRQNSLPSGGPVLGRPVQIYHHTVTDFFATDYLYARDRFRSGVYAAGGHIESILLSATGPSGEDLTIDIGWFGSPTPRRAFIHSSGLHGVEGFAGSAIQLQWLEEGIPPLPADGAVAIVHAMNPFGMAWLRRVNENNVDLNRNFLGADEEYSGAPEHYADLDSFLDPESPPSRDFFPLRAACKILRYGMPALRQAIAGGQYDFPRGLFFGGRQHEQGPRRFQVYISQRFAAADRLVAIDVHTGLGRFAEDCLLVNADADADRSRAAEMQLAYGDRLQPLDPARGIAYRSRGSQDGLYSRMFPAAQVYFAVQEFGTRHPIVVLAALRAENRRHHHGGPASDPVPLDDPAKMRLLEVFCPSAEKWRERVLARGREVVRQGLALAFEEGRA